MDRYFKLAHSVAAGQVTYRVPGQKENYSGFARCLAQLAQRAR